MGTLKRLTDLAAQLGHLYREGRSIGVDFETIADQLSVHVAVKGPDLRYRYVNLPGQVNRLLPTGLSGQVTDADLLGAEAGQLLREEDRQALGSAGPVVIWSEPAAGAQGHTERIPQVKLGLRGPRGEVLGVLDVAPADGPGTEAGLEVRRMNEALDLIADILGLLMRCDDEASLLERLCSTLVVRGGYLAAAVVPIEADRRQAGVPLSLAGDRDELALPGAFRLDDPVWESHPVARAAEAGVCIVHKQHGADDPAPWRQARPTLNAQALIALPLRADDDVQAVLLMACDGLERFAPSRVVLLRRMADELSLGIELLRSRQRLASERRQREIHLRQQLLTSQRLSLATESGEVGIWEWDLARGIVSMDERSVTQHGLPSHTHTLPAATLQGWVHPEDAAAVDQAIAGVITLGQPADITFRTTPPDGRQRRLRLHMSPLRDDKNTGTIVGLLGATQDVSDLAQNTRRLHDLDAKLRLATQATGLGLWELDLVEQTLLLDNRSAQIHGLEPTQGSLTLTAWLGWIHPGQRQEMAAQLKASQAQPTVGQLECAITPPDGRLRRVLINWASQADATGRVIQLVGTQVDVTDRRRDEARMAQTHQRLALMAGATGVGHWRYDLREGFTFDDAMYRLLGATVQPYPAAAWLMEMCLPASQREALELALITADDQLEVSLQWQGLDGLSRHVVWMGTVDRDARRTVIRGEGLCIDITVQHKAEAARHELQAPPPPKPLAAGPGRAPAEPTPHPEATPGIEPLAARIGGELRSPLNALLGFVQLLRNSASATQTPGTGQQDDYLQEIEKAGWHLMELVNDAMDLSRIQSGAQKVETQTVPLRELIGELQPLVEQQAATRQVRFEAITTGPWPTVAADRRLLKQALVYLCGHAVHASPSGTRVILSIEPGSSEVILRLHGQGPALPPAQREQLFDPAAQALTALQGGSGMRLAIARQSLHAMGGHLQALEGEAGQGTTFVVGLPHAPQPEAALNPASELALAPRPPQLTVDITLQGRILYVEDNPSNVLLVRECLTLRPAVELAVATNVQEGLAAIAAERFDLVLLDLQLPDGDGYAVLKRLREYRGRPSPCIALTAAAMLNERNRALEAGFDEFWTKPIKLPEFLAGLDRWLAPRRSRSRTVT
jgi:hypothetical protein